MITNALKKELRYAKNVTITLNYIILYRGSSVVIYDRHLVLQKKISKLKFVYKGYVSPDEKTLLLVSNTNHVYIVSLNNFSLVKIYTVEKPYNGNLEGLACWCNSNSFLLPIQNRVTNLSVVRKIICGSSLVTEDYILEKFWIVFIAFVRSANKILLIGLDRNEQSWNIIWMDEDNNYTIHTIKDFNEAIFNVELMENTQQILLTGETKIHCCHFNGLPSDLLQAYPLDIIKKIGLPNFFKLSPKNQNIAYLGSYDSLIIMDLKDNLIIKYCPMIFGAQNIEELDDFLIVLTHNGIKLLSLTDYTPI